MSDVVCDETECIGNWCLIAIPGAPQDIVRDARGVNPSLFTSLYMGWQGSVG